MHNEGQENQKGRMIHAKKEKPVKNARDWCNDCMLMYGMRESKHNENATAGSRTDAGNCYHAGRTDNRRDNETGRKA